MSEETESTKLDLTITVNLPGDKEVELNDVVAGDEFGDNSIDFVFRAVRALYPKATSAVFTVVF